MSSSIARPQAPISKRTSSRTEAAKESASKNGEAAHAPLHLSDAWYSAALRKARKDNASVAQRVDGKISAAESALMDNVYRAYAVAHRALLDKAELERQFNTASAGALELVKAAAAPHAFGQYVIDAFEEVRGEFPYL